MLGYTRWDWEDFGNIFNHWCDKFVEKYYPLREGKYSVVCGLKLGLGVFGDFLNVFDFGFIDGWVKIKSQTSDEWTSSQPL